MSNQQGAGAASLFALAARGERLLMCEQCGAQFWDAPERALTAWDDEHAVYLCEACWSQVEEVGDDQ